MLSYIACHIIFPRASQAGPRRPTSPDSGDQVRGIDLANPRPANPRAPGQPAAAAARGRRGRRGRRGTGQPQPGQDSHTHRQDNHSQDRTGHTHTQMCLGNRIRRNGSVVGQRWVKLWSKLGQQWVNCGSIGVKIGPKTRIWVKFGSKMGQKWVKTGSKVVGSRNCGGWGRCAAAQANLAMCQTWFLFAAWPTDLRKPWAAQALPVWKTKFTQATC